MNDAGDVYYIVLRGNGRDALFHSDADYCRFGSVVGEAVRTCDASVHAFCWTPGEARLAVRIDSMPIATFAQHLASEHARQSARELAASTATSESRYRGVLIEGRSALLELVRHIHLAPVKAGLATQASEYRYSSQRAYLNLEDIPWLTREAVYEALTRLYGDTRAAYERFMREGLANNRAASLPADERVEPR